MSAKCKRCKSEMNSSEEAKLPRILSPYLVPKANGIESPRLKDLEKLSTMPGKMSYPGTILEKIMKSGQALEKGRIRASIEKVEFGRVPER